MPERIPVSPQSSPNTAVIPGSENLTSSGNGASGVQDWYIHVQTVDVMYLRKNQYDSATSSTVGSPQGISNYLEVHYTVQTTDEIMQNAVFSSTTPSTGGELWENQTLELVTAVGTSGGFGVCGVVNTSSAGYIRRPARTNAAGDFLDPVGHCTKSGNLIVDQMPGEYDQSFDTSAQVNSCLTQIVGELPQRCPNFIATLVDL